MPAVELLIAVTGSCRRQYSEEPFSTSSTVAGSGTADAHVLSHYRGDAAIVEEANSIRSMAICVSTVTVGGVDGRVFPARSSTVCVSV